MFFISKKIWFQLLRTLRCCLCASFFKAVCKLVSFKSYGFSTGLVHVKMMVVFVTRVQHLAETFLRKLRCGKGQ